jgi:hypothetical protein
MHERDIWFLDLEETIITDFTNPIIMNLEVVKEHFKNIGVKKVHIFSAAMWDEREKKIFTQPNFKPWLERMFEVEIETFPTMKEVMNEILWKTGTFWELTEFIAIWGKARAFQDFCRLVHPDKNCFLIDDSVQNEIILRRDTGNFIELIHIDHLHNWKRFT